MTGQPPVSATGPARPPAPPCDATNITSVQREGPPREPDRVAVHPVDQLACPPVARAQCDEQWQEVVRCRVCVRHTRGQRPEVRQRVEVAPLDGFQCPGVEGRRGSCRGGHFTTAKPLVQEICPAAARPICSRAVASSSRARERAPASRTRRPPTVTVAEKVSLAAASSPATSTVVGSEPLAFAASVAAKLTLNALRTWASGSSAASSAVAEESAAGRR